MTVTYLVDVGDELSFSRSVNLLVVGSHLALDGEQKNLQVPLLCEPARIQFILLYLKIYILLG